MATLLLFHALFIAATNSQTLWVYDSSSWREIADAKLNIGSQTTYTFAMTLDDCKSYCESAGLDCLSINWNGDTSSSTSTGLCELYSNRFGFKSGGFDTTDPDNFANGKLTLLEYSDGRTYIEKPLDMDDNAGLHITANALRLNNYDYDQYDPDDADPETYNLLFNYHHFSLYYRAGQPGYVNRSDSTSVSKYSAIVTMENVEDAEECAMYCTRNRGVIDEQLGTRCVSFNYNTDGRCHLLPFSADGTSYLLSSLVSDDAETVTSGWFYYEGLVGDGCWVVQSQCRKWDDATYRSEQLAAGNNYTVGDHVGIIRQYAYDTTGCSSCSNTADFNKEYEFVCMDLAREFHEDRCDNDADSATVAFWGQDGAGVAAFWNSWDLSTGCVIDLSSFDCLLGGNDTNTRFAGRKFRDSIGEEEFAAATSKSRCWDRAAEWYDYCGLEDQAEDGETSYLNVSYPSDGSFYVEPAVNCSCDSYGMKLEHGFGMERAFCTRNVTSEPLCYRKSYADYWSEWDILCEDLSEGHACSTSSSGLTDGSGCYLYYAEPSFSGLVAREYTCSAGGAYNFDSDSFTESSYIKYREILCAEITSGDNAAELKTMCENGEWNATDCLSLAITMHNSCGNDLEDADQQIVVWWRASGQIMVYPDYASPYETTAVRGIAPAATYTEDPNDVTIDFMPIRNGRWQTFSPSKSGALRQLDVYYSYEAEATLTLTVWSGHGITDSIYLGQASVTVAAGDVAYVRFPLTDITLTSGDEYTWQVTSDRSDNLGSLGYVRGDGYTDGIGDLAWDYLFVCWVEGTLTEQAPLAVLDVIALAERPWFEIWCIMIMVLLVIFIVFLCLLHWKRVSDEKRERKEDRKFQAELRDRAMFQAEAERNARLGSADELHGDEHSMSYSNGQQPIQFEDEQFEYYGNDILAEPEQEAGDQGLLGPPTQEPYDRVISDSTGAIPDDEAGKKKKKKRKKKKKKRVDDDEEY